VKSRNEIWRFSNAKGAHGLTHNPGRDFRDLVTSMAKASPKDGRYPLSSHFVPVISIIAASFSIEAT